MTRAKRSFSKKAKRSFPQKKASIPRRQALRQEPAWRWRAGSALMVVMLASILTPKADAAVAVPAAFKAPAKPEVNVVVIGDFYSYGYATSSEATLRKSVPPTLQALNQVQATDSGVHVNVLFIPVTAATSSSLFDPGNQAELPALIGAVTHSSVVIVGIGGGNAPLAGPMRSVLFGTGTPAKTFPQLMTSFDDGYYLYSQTALLDAVAAHAAPGTSIVTLGYPAIQGEQLSSGFSWWSPYTWNTVNQQQANMSDQLVSALNTANEQATSVVAAAHSGLHFLYADLSGAMQSTGPSGSQGQGGHAQTIIGDDLLPYINQAVDNELVTMNVGGTQDTLPATSASQWKLNVVLPVPTQAPTETTSRHKSRTETQPPQNNQDNPTGPVLQPPAWPGLSASPPPAAGGPAPARSPEPDGGRAAASSPPASPSEGATSTGQGSGNGHGHRGGHGRRDGHGDGQHSTPPTDNGQPADTSQPTDSSQPTSSSQPADTSQPTDSSQPADSSQPTPAPEPKPEPTAQPQPQPTASSSSSASSPSSSSSSPSADRTSAGPGGTSTAGPVGCEDPAMNAAVLTATGNSECCGVECVTPPSSTPTATAPASTSPTSATAPASPTVTSTSGSGGGNNGSPSAAPPNTTPSPHRPITLPMIPAPMGPLPKPLAPTPGGPNATGPGTDPSPTEGTSTTPAGATTPASTATPSGTATPASATPPSTATATTASPSGTATSATATPASTATPSGTTAPAAATTPASTAGSQSGAPGSTNGFSWFGGPSAGGTAPASGTASS